MSRLLRISSVRRAVVALVVMTGAVVATGSVAGASGPTLNFTDNAYPTPVTPGATIGFQISASADVSNSVSVTNVSVTDALPPGPGLDWFINQGEGEPGNCNITGSVGSQTLHCFDGDLPPGSEADVDVQSATDASSDGSYQDAAVASGGNISPIDASATAIVEPAPIVAKVAPGTGDATGGTAVTITGTSFTGATQVTFGDAAATGFAVVNDGTITATSPPGAPGTVDVIVIAAGQSTSNPADEFTYTSTQAPDTESCDPNCTATSSTDLNDTSVTVTGTTGTTNSQISLAVNTDTLSCGTDRSYVTAVSTLTATSDFAPGSDLTVTETVGNEPSTKGVKVCFAASGHTTGTLLQPCRHNRPAPCLVSLREHHGSVVATFSVPAADPRFWTGGAPVSVTSFSPQQGAPGAKLTLKGKNLTGVVNVVVGGVRAHVTSASSSKLVVTVPQGAVTGLISITAAAGTATSSSPFTVTSSG